MKKLVVFSLLFVFVAGTILPACTRAKPGCRKNHRKIKQMRKDNSHFTM